MLQAEKCNHMQRRGMFNTLRPKQNGHHFADDIFKCIFLNENVWISIKIYLKFVPKGQINNIPALVQIMAWCQPGNKPLSEPMMFSLLMHICITPLNETPIDTLFETVSNLAWCYWANVTSLWHKQVLSFVTTRVQKKWTPHTSHCHIP